ncbi:hypothetical protein CBM2634_B100027 [Cupriavidus taiwanensis]|uniref:Uncharacterized protein n=1 Tax=Cupriavidus taiwanensis TaxID=164546 RepID=A0A375J384_9BURK|nr:hypothetical protein CBM2634_B100027 [Cupriavidus taiwanensis]
MRCVANWRNAICRIRSGRWRRLPRCSDSRNPAPSRAGSRRSSASRRRAGARTAPEAGRLLQVLHRGDAGGHQQLAIEPYLGARKEDRTPAPVDHAFRRQQPAGPVAEEVRRQRQRDRVPRALARRRVEAGIAGGGIEQGAEGAAMHDAAAVQHVRRQRKFQLDVVVAPMGDADTDAFECRIVEAVSLALACCHCHVHRPDFPLLDRASFLRDPCVSDNLYFANRPFRLHESTHAPRHARL